MPKNIFSRVQSRSLTRHHKIAMAGVATLGAAAIGFSAVPSGASTKTTTEAAQPAAVAYSNQQIKDVKASVTDQMAGASLKAEQIAAKKKAEAARQAKEAASRAAQRAEATKAVSYPNNLDGWIRESLAILKKHDIPASYDGIHRNIIRESSGNPKAINNWDINAINGIPSKGLLQVIPPTFKHWHVPGTSWDIYDPVANITAACNYAADKYGSMDNVDSAY